MFLITIEFNHFLILSIKFKLFNFVYLGSNASYFLAFMFCSPAF